MYGPLWFPLSTTCSSWHFHWHFPGWYLRQVVAVEVPDGTLSYHHEFKGSLGGMVPVHRGGINSTLGCLQVGTLKKPPVTFLWLTNSALQKVLVLSALCLNPVCIVSPWNRNDKN